MGVLQKQRNSAAHGLPIASPSLSPWPLSAARVEALVPDPDRAGQCLPRWRCVAGAGRKAGEVRSGAHGQPPSQPSLRTRTQQCSQRLGLSLLLLAKVVNHGCHGRDWLAGSAASQPAARISLRTTCGAVACGLSLYIYIATSTRGYHGGDPCTATVDPLQRIWGLQGDWGIHFLQWKVRFVDVLPT
jgi:hypothetical protein